MADHQSVASTTWLGRKANPPQSGTYGAPLSATLRLISAVTCPTAVSSIRPRRQRFPVPSIFIRLRFLIVMRTIPKIRLPFVGTTSAAAMSDQRTFLVRRGVLTIKTSVSARIPARRPRIHRIPKPPKRIQPAMWAPMEPEKRAGTNDTNSMTAITARAEPSHRPLGGLPHPFS